MAMQDNTEEEEEATLDREIIYKYLLFALHSSLSCYNSFCVGCLSSQYERIHNTASTHINSAIPLTRFTEIKVKVYNRERNQERRTPDIQKEKRN